MRPPSPLAITALVMALLVAWTTAVAGSGPPQRNRLVHRSTPTSPKRGLQELLEHTVEEIGKKAKQIFSQPGRKAGDGIDRFVVLHADSTGPDALNVLVDAGAKEGLDTEVWLYSDMHRWNPEHVDHLWNFACGRTQGRWYVMMLRIINF